MKKTKQQILRLIVFLSFIQLSSVLSAQVVPNIDWVQHYVWKDSTDNSSSTLDANNNVYVTGYASNNMTRDLIVLKYDSLGTLLWFNTYDNGGDDVGTGIKVDVNGNVYVCGTSYDATTQNDAIFLVYNSSGTQLNFNRFDAGYNLNDEALDLKINPLTGYIYAIGTSDNGSNTDVLALKYKPNGALDWGMLYDSPYNNNDIGVALCITSNDDVFCTGNAYTGSDNDIWVFMINNNGSQYWNNLITGTKSNADDFAQGIVTSGDNAVVCGQVYNNTTDEDYTTFRIDGSGSIVWQQDYDNGNNVQNFATSLIRDSIGNIGVTGLVMGGSGWEYHTIMYDSTGNQLWVNQEQTGLWGAMIEPRIAVDTVAHHFYVSGSIQNSTSDVFVYQISPFSGQTKWKQSYDGPAYGYDVGTGLSVNGVGVVYLSSNCANTSWGYNFTTIKISQTPVYFPVDPYYENPAHDKAYYKNSGQLISTSSSLVPKVLYYNHTSDPMFYIQKDMVNYVFSKSDTVTSTLDTLERIDVNFTESNQLSRIYEFEETGTNLNYFLAHCDSMGITNVKGYKKLFIPNIYPNIDLHYSSNNNGIKYFFVLKPKASVSSIKLTINGAQSTSLSSGNLFLNGKLDTVKIGTTFAYNAIPTSPTSGFTVPVSCSWNSLGSNMYGFSVPSYTNSAPLVIVVAVPNSTSATYAPIQNMEYSTFYGSSSNESFGYIKVDDNTNNRYIAGGAISNLFPTVNSITSYNALSDAILLKYSGTDTLRYATFYGGSGQDWSIGTTVKSNGNVYLVGYTASTDLPINSSIRSTADQQTTNGWLTTNTLSSKSDGFIFEISGNGTVPAHKWSRYIGGVLSDIVKDITLDRNDNLYIVGSSNSCNYPTKNAHKTGGPGCQFGNNSDIVATKIDSTCKVVWSTYFGGDNTLQPNPPSGPWINRDDAAACDVDSLGRLYIVGSAYASSDKTPFNGTSNTSTTSIFNPTSDGNGAILIRLDSPTNTLITVGMYTEVGYNYTTIRDIKVMKDQKILFCGITNDTIQAFPLKTKTGSYNRAIPGNIYVRRGFFSLLDSNMTNLWTTHFNKMTSTSDLDLKRIAVSDNGSFMLSGRINGDSITFPATSPPNVYTKSSSVGQNYEAFISYFYKQNSDYIHTHSHFLGGWGHDDGNEIDVYKSSKLYIVGKTSTADYPIASVAANANLIDPTFNGNSGSEDGFVTRFDLSAVLISVKEVKGNEINSILAFPNPAHNQFFINVANVKEKKNITLEIYDLTGKLVYSDKITNLSDDLIQINCQSWANGLYLVTLTTSETKYAGKVIKQ